MKKRQLMKGNEALCHAAIDAGCQCFFGYPITPASEIAESDANPVLVYEEGKGAKVVDARIILKKK